MPDLEQLRTFLAVAEHLSFTRAADALGVSQQAVSRSVRALEDELGVVVLERTTREVRVTPAGAVLVEHGADLLSRAEALDALVRSVEDGLAGTVDVGVTPAVGHGDRIAVAAALREGRPDLRVALRDVRPGQLRSLLRAGELDVALTRARGLDEPAISASPLRPTEMVLCVPADHALAGGAPVPLAALDGQRLLVPSPAGTPYTDLLLARLQAAGARAEPVEARVTGGDAILGELGPTGSVALMPHGAPLPPQVVSVPIAGGLTLPLFVLWAGGRPSPAAQRLIERLGAPPASAASAAPAP